MNTVRKYMGIIWMLIAVVAGYYLIVNQALPKFRSAHSEDLIPAIIYTFILTPIIVGGLGLFGYYAFQNEYEIRD